jgi:hypothetical protein
MRVDDVKPILDDDAVNERADDLAAAALNGLRLALVTIGPPATAATAQLELYFLNSLHVADILADITASPNTASSVFRIRGGQRLPAGPATGQVKCTAVAAGSTDANGELISLLLTIAPVGDYSTYTLELTYDPDAIDPFFAELPFKFRPGCFTADCSPSWAPGRARVVPPPIDYLAKDYDSFRHTLIAAMMDRVPGWRTTSEADLDQVLIDLFAAAGDELSDYQDRVMNEAYLGTARKRVSIARHARLVDYHIHQGNQSSTWLGVILDPAAAPFTLGEELITWAGHPDLPSDWIYFATRERRLPVAERALLDPLLNELQLHTWTDAEPALRAGTTHADIVSTVAGAAKPEADRVRDLINAGTLRALLIEEKRNPLTGRVTGFDPRKRQRLGLTPDAVVLRDPLTDTWITRVSWDRADALRWDFSFTTSCPDGRVNGVSAFHGNLLRVHQGIPVVTHFHEPGADLPMDTGNETHRHYERRLLYGESRDVRCPLPLAPLAYLRTATGGEVAPESTLYVDVEEQGIRDPWDEVESLVHSDDSAEEGDHFVVETDERQRTVLRFGNGVNGRWLPDDAIVHCEYQVGGGTSGNVGASTITHFRDLTLQPPGVVTSVWNPCDVTDGRDPEPVAEIVRNAPEAYRARQLRAITLADYVARAEEVPGVSRAMARYAWTGSWRTVRVVIDPEGTSVLEPTLADQVAAHLESVRLIGEDIELRPPRFVPIEIDVSLCVCSDVWPEDLRAVLEQEFSDGYTPDGRRGFFHPDAWTFGQTLHASEIEGRLQQIAGVDHVISIDMRRFGRPPSTTVPGPAALEVAVDEIIEAQNDPDHFERGRIDFDLQGGRR